MPIIRISDAVHRAIRAASTAPGGFEAQGVRRSDGDWDVPITQDTLDRINKYRLEGESISDTILRGATLAASGSGKLN